MINGNGYFVVATGEGGIGYTRSGRFQFDGTGNLLTSDGYHLMGYLADAAGIIDLSGTISQIDIRKGQFVPAVATSEVSAAVNLDSQAYDAGTSPTGVADTFATSIEIFDSLGVSHDLS
jgi:flagellar hook protein FlgE